MEKSSTKPLIVSSESIRVRNGFYIPASLPGQLEKLCNVIWEGDMGARKEELSKVEGFVPGDECYYGEEFLSKLPNLKCVSIPSRGYEHVDVKYIKEKGIAVGHNSDEQSEAVAEFTIALLFASSKCLQDGFALWKGEMPAGRIPEFGQIIGGKTLGIVGMGSIGRLVAKMASGFNMKIIYHNRNQRPPDEEKALNVKYHPTLSGLLKDADFVVLSAPLSPQTANMMGEEQFKQMKSTATLINIGRGALVDQDALLNALRTKQIGGAALDTVTPEPLPRDHPLLHMQNVIVTPHMAWATAETKQKIDDCTIDNLMAGLKGEPMPNPIP